MPSATENESQSHAPGGGRWQTFKAQFGGWFSRGEEAAPQQAPTAPSQSEQPRRYDLETPGPTEAAGGSFQQLHSKSKAEREASHLSPSQDYRLDRAPAALTPTASYILPTLPSPAAVARDERVEERIRQIADPQQRAKAAALLKTIRSEVTTQQQQRGRAQEQDRELER